MTINISEDDYNTLKWLGKNYYVVKGERPIKPEVILHRLIEKKMREADTIEYQTTGFDRQ